MDSFVKVLTSQVGKYLFAVPFLLFGLMHMTSASDMAGMAPGGEIMVYITGVCLIGAAVSIFIGKYTKLAMFLLGIMLILFVILIHVPMVSDPAAAAAGMGISEEVALQMGMSGMLKDLGLAGGAWVLGDRYDKLL